MVRQPAPSEGLREALARVIEGGYADDSIDHGLYQNDPVYHAVVYEVRRARQPAPSEGLREALEEAIGLALGGGYQHLQARWRRIATEYDRGQPGPSEGLRECGICGEYTAKGIEVHEVCLDGWRDDRYP